MNTKEYLGDSVYADLLYGAAIQLTTENGLPDDPANTIILEPWVYQKLVEYHKRHFSPKKD